MFTCPACRKTLKRFKAARGFFWACESCKGRAATVPFLRQTLLREYVNQIWEYARAEKGVRRRPCPACGERMIDVPVVHGAVSQWIDVCTRCQFVWFDAKEMEVSPRAEAPPSGTGAGGEQPLSPEAREALALQQVNLLAERARSEPDDGGWEGDAWWKVVAAILFLPVEEEGPVVRREPLATWILCLVIAFVTLASFHDLDGAVREFGLIPAQAGRLGGLTFVTSFFLHAGVLHLVGNLYFLALFGTGVEDFLGRWRYLLLLAAASLAGDVLHIAGGMQPEVPCIGASGGISGVIAFYALRFPRARLAFYGNLRKFQMPAWVGFSLWLGIQIGLVMLEREGLSHIAGLAHLGGAMAGMACWAVWRKQA
jgi:membrane associated rhomboid family serine protease/Zn-finger nucleic acid-binding protein